MLVETQLFYLSSDLKTSKTTGEPYQAINFLDESDNKFFAMGKGLDLDSFEKFDKVNCQLKITLGTYTRIEVINIFKNTGK